MTPYLDLVQKTLALRQAGRELPLGGFPPAPRVQIPPNAPTVLLFSPHPDDECIVGGLALRLLRESQWRVINVAVTQGSRKDRQAGRYAELDAACRFLQFDLVPTAPGGLEKVNPKSRASDPDSWRASVGIVSRILSEHRPRVVFFPHELDWNSTHIGTHHLVVDALGTLPAGGPPIFVVETEFWGQMPTPNLMVESPAEDVADLMAACSFHVGEVQRNPYHLSQTAWMQDNVRRGGELVGGQGGAAPDYPFATLYRLRRWQDGALTPFYSGGRLLPATENPASLFA
ncbi:MAG: PIG-L deacetylase family protein [Limisphaerales bacterium]